MIFEGVSNFRKKKNTNIPGTKKILNAEIVFYSHQQNRNNLQSQKWI